MEAAIGDLNFVLATTARPRGMVKKVLTPESAARELAARAARGERTGVLFGPERAGLENDTIALADAVVTAPVNPAFASLSLPQSVLLLSYEWLKTCAPELSLGRATETDGPAVEGMDISDTRPATRAELLGLFEHLETELDASGFLRPPEKRPTMVRNIRNMFHRMGCNRAGYSHLARHRRLAGSGASSPALRSHSSAPFLLLRLPPTMLASGAEK